MDPRLRWGRFAGCRSSPEVTSTTFPRSSATRGFLACFSRSGSLGGGCSPALTSRFPSPVELRSIPPGGWLPDRHSRPGGGGSAHGADRGWPIRGHERPGGAAARPGGGGGRGARWGSGGARKDDAARSDLGRPSGWSAPARVKGERTTRPATIAWAGARSRASRSRIGSTGRRADRGNDAGRTRSRGGQHEPRALRRHEFGRRAHDRLSVHGTAAHRRRR